MIRMRQGRKVLVFVGIVAAFFLIAGCAGLKAKKTGPTPQITKQKEKGPSALYYDFGDVLIPGELKVDKKASFVCQTLGFSAGLLVLKGRVEINSLAAFFGNNMTKDNWRTISSFKSPRTIMLFRKENRWCLINITEKDFTTHVEIWVAPMINEAESGLIK